MIRPVVLILLLQATISFSQVPPKTDNNQHPGKNKDLKKDTATVNELNRLAKAHMNSDLSQAEQYAAEALSLSETLRYPKGLALSCLNMGSVYFRQGNYDKSRTSFQQSIEIAEKLKDKDLLAKGYGSMFSICFVKGQYDSAGFYTDKSIEFAEEAGNKKIIAQAKSNKGVLNGIQGNHTLAIGNVREYLKIFESLEDGPNVASQLGRIGHTFELAGNYEEALNYLKRSLEIQLKLNDKREAGWALLNIGVTYSRISEDSLALDYYFKSLEMAEEIDYQRLILACLDNIGGWYSLKGNFKKSNEYLQKAYTLSEDAGYNSRTVYITGNIAENYLLSGDLDRAEEFEKKHLEYAVNDGEISEQKEGYYNLSRIYAAKKEYQKAYNALAEYIIINDSIFSREKSQQVEALRTEYETEKKEQQIAHLNQQKKAEKFRRNALAGFSGLILVIGVLLIRNQRSKIREQKVLYEKDLDVERTKSRFFANITHELRTPLTLILGPIEILKSRITAKDDRNQLEVMEKNSTRLLDLINQLLDLSKIESGNMKLQPEQVDIGMLVGRVAGLFESLIELNKISLTVINSLADSIAWLDADKIEKVFVNLISNALKFTPEGGSIHIALFDLPDNVNDINRKIRIIVKDSGKGIPERDLEHIFDQYFQSGDTLNNEYTGTGIGLALTKELVELHEGTITVTSEPGRGSEFILILPVLKFSDSAVPAEQKEEGRQNPVQAMGSDTGILVHESAVETISSGQKPLILIIEDNAEVRDYIQSILNPDYLITLSGDGKQGLEKALELIPDLIISDVMMPKLNGYELCEKIKTNEKTSHIPVILLTARGSLEDRLKGLENRADAYLVKPFVPKELITRVENLIESRKRLRERFSRELVFKPGEVQVNSVEEQFLEKLNALVEKNIENEHLGVDDLARSLMMSRSQLHRKVKALTNLAPNEFIRKYRLIRSMELIKGHAGTTAEIAFSVGFSSPSYFTRCFREHFGYPPADVGKHIAEA